MTASRASLREARATFCPSASYVRPDSERGNVAADVELVRLADREPCSLELQVRLEPVAAALAAEAGLLVAAERRAGSNWLNVFAQTTPARSRSAIQRMREPLSVQTPAERPYGVLFAFSIASSGVRKVMHREHRPEDLLLRDPVALRDAREDGRREPVALLGQPARRLVDLGALLLARLRRAP